MKKAAVVAAVCSLLFAACTGGDAGPKIKPPRIDEGRVTMATVGGRALPFFTFSARLNEGEAKIVGAECYYSDSGDLYKTGPDGATLVDPKPIGGAYISKLHRVEYITSNDPAKKAEDAKFEAFLDKPDTKIAFQWEVQWKEDGSDKTYTAKSPVYTITHDDIASARLAKDVMSKQ